MGLMWQQDDWRSRGACLAADPDLFFPISSRCSTQTNRAKAICASCLVRAECADFALARPDVRGIWGGTTDDERKKLRRSRATAARKLVADSGSAAA
jgi:WhiB family redox-sensing transcriptional regulator